MFLEVAVLLFILFACLIGLGNEPREDDEDDVDLDALRQTMSERRRNGMTVSQRKGTIQTKLFYKKLKEGESLRSLRNVWSSAKDLYQANSVDGSQRSSISRSWRAAETSVKQFQKHECSICLEMEHSICSVNLVQFIDPISTKIIDSL